MTGVGLCGTYCTGKERSEIMWFRRKQNWKLGVLE
jgi:hypothetical protein